MAEQKEKFVAGAAARGVDAAKASELWDYIEPFAGYGFNKSHSVAYALLAYQTAYLKAHYPVAFMAAMLNSELSSSDSIAKYIKECRAMGIEVAPPDINESDWRFTVVDGAIRFGLGGSRGSARGRWRSCSTPAAGSAASAASPTPPPRSTAARPTTRSSKC